jgi:hypothetical protein
MSKKNKTKIVQTTLYDIMLKAFKDAGYTVNEGSWIESVGYDVPTTEYWFDVEFHPKNIFKEKGYTSHFWFKNNKDVLLEHSLYEVKYKIEEDSKILT